MALLVTSCVCHVNEGTSQWTTASHQIISSEVDISVGTLPTETVIPYSLWLILYYIGTDLHPRDPGRWDFAQKPYGITVSRGLLVRFGVSGVWVCTLFYFVLQIKRTFHLYKFLANPIVIFFSVWKRKIREYFTCTNFWRLEQKMVKPSCAPNVCYTS